MSGTLSGLCRHLHQQANIPHTLHTKFKNNIFFKTGLYSGCPGNHCVDQLSSSSQKSTYLCFPSARIAINKSLKIQSLKNNQDNTILRYPPFSNHLCFLYLVCYFTTIHFCFIYIYINLQICLCESF